jgi:hypothetical protein
MYIYCIFLPYSQQLKNYTGWFTKGKLQINIYNFYLCKFIEVEGKYQYRVEVSNRFVALEDLQAEVEI